MLHKNIYRLFSNYTINISTTIKKWEGAAMQKSLSVILLYWSAFIVSCGAQFAMLTTSSGKRVMHTHQSVYLSHL